VLSLSVPHATAFSPSAHTSSSNSTRPAPSLALPTRAGALSRFRPPVGVRCSSVRTSAIDRVTVVARTVAQRGRMNTWPFSAVVFLVVFVVEAPFSNPPWTTWENLLGNVIAGLLVVAIASGYLDLWPGIAVFIGGATDGCKCAAEAETASRSTRAGSNSTHLVKPNR
jgi:hypothetical protein